MFEHGGQHHLNFITKKAAKGMGSKVYQLLHIGMKGNQRYTDHELMLANIIRVKVGDQMCDSLQ